MTETGQYVTCVSSFGVRFKEKRALEGETSISNKLKEKICFQLMCFYQVNITLKQPNAIRRIYLLQTCRIETALDAVRAVENSLHPLLLKMATLQAHRPLHARDVGIRSCEADENISFSSSLRK